MCDTRHATNFQRVGAGGAGARRIIAVRRSFVTRSTATNKNIRSSLVTAHLFDFREDRSD